MPDPNKPVVEVVAKTSGDETSEESEATEDENDTPKKSRFGIWLANFLIWWKEWWGGEPKSELPFPELKEDTVKYATRGEENAARYFASMAKKRAEERGETPKYQGTSTNTGKENSSKYATSLKGNAISATKKSVERLEESVTKKQSKLDKLRKKALELSAEYSKISPRVSDYESRIQAAVKAKENYESFCQEIYGGYQPKTAKSLNITEQFTVLEGSYGLIVQFTSQDIEAMESITLFSDGLSAVKGEDFRDVGIELTDYNSDLTKFAKQKFVSKFVRGGSQNGDDISCAAVLFNPKNSK